MSAVRRAAGTEQRDAAATVSRSSPAKSSGVRAAMAVRLVWGCGIAGEEVGGKGKAACSSASAKDAQKRAAP